MDGNALPRNSLGFLSFTRWPFWVVLCFGALLVGGCGDLIVGRRTATGSGIIQEKELSFQSKESFAAGATVNLEKAAEVYYTGTDPKSETAHFIYQWAIRMVGVLGVNTQYDASDPDALKDVLGAGTKALEEKNAQIDALKRDVKAANEATAKAEKKARGLWGWVKLLLWIGIGLFVVQIITGIPVFTGSIRILKRLGKQTTKGIQQFREDLKEKAAQGDVAAKQTLDDLDTTLDAHQDDKVKARIRKIKNGK